MLSTSPSLPSRFAMTSFSIAQSIAGTRKRVVAAWSWQPAHPGPGDRGAHGGAGRAVRLAVHLAEGVHVVHKLVAIGGSVYRGPVCIEFSLNAGVEIDETDEPRERPLSPEPVKIGDVSRISDRDVMTATIPAADSRR